MKWKGRRKHEVQKGTMKYMLVVNSQMTLDSMTNREQEAQLMLTTGSTRLAVSRGQQTWYYFRSIATFR